MKNLFKTALKTYTLKFPQLSKAVFLRAQFEQFGESVLSKRCTFSKCLQAYFH